MQSIVEEFEGVSLGDRRLERRLSIIASSMEAAPEESFVEQAKDIAALEATYRFLSNENVSAEAIFGGHVAKTVERAAVHDAVLVLHDTTEFRFGGAQERTGFGRLSSKKREGFLAHYSMCVSIEGEPLGSLDLHAWSRFDQKTRTKANGTLRDPDRESLRWVDSALSSSEHLHGRSTPIHVMDREGDQFELYATLRENNERFVVRLGHNRRLKRGRGRDATPMLNEALASGPVRFIRNVQLGRRERDASTKRQKTFPEREGRNAKLEIRAQQMDLYRCHQHSEHLPDFLDLNFVEAREVDAPPGATPVIWRLVTTEPIGSDEEVARVIDIYRKRWVIEEFFKAIKTGCRFESHQLEDIKGLLVALSIESAIAWQLLRLRYLSRRHSTEPGDCLLSNAQHKVLIQLRASRGTRTQFLCVQDVICEIARLGMHLKNNGPPGWLVLKRGLKKLNLLAEGLSLAEGLCVTKKDVINL